MWSWYLISWWKDMYLSGGACGKDKKNSDSCRKISEVWCRMGCYQLEWLETADLCAFLTHLIWSVDVSHDVFPWRWTSQIRKVFPAKCSWKQKGTQGNYGLKIQSVWVFSFIRSEYVLVVHVPANLSNFAGSSIGNPLNRMEPYLWMRSSITFLFSLTVLHHSSLFFSTKGRTTSGNTFPS